MHNYLYCGYFEECLCPLNNNRPNMFTGADPGCESGLRVGVGVNLFSVSLYIGAPLGTFQKRST